MRIISSLALIIFFSCSPRQVKVLESAAPASDVSVNGKLFATFYQQRAAEYKALCFQAYNIARFRLDQYQSVTNLPKAIITDIDETVLDNSPYQARQTLQGKDYDQTSWFAWTDKATADTVPGAGAFLKYAATRYVEIFYVTNREQRERDNTIKNLRRFNLPNADSLHVLCRAATSGKEPRRQSVAQNHEIVLLIGDNLADFSSLFDKKSFDERLNNTRTAANDFGSRFIVIPNTVYGDWEGAMFNYNRGLTLSQKDSIIRAALTPN